MRQVHFSELPSLVGQDVGHSDWFHITQQETNDFADVTRDHEWIHVDVERANREFGGPIAHGYHVLCLLPHFMEQILKIDGVRNGLNYGLNNLRFTNMVRVGKRVRAHQKIISIEPRADGGVMMKSAYTIEIEGEARPACVTEALFILYGE
ncbi:MAG: MaoC family dehydratase [Hyphomonadaceae bacterium]